MAPRRIRMLRRRWPGGPLRLGRLLSRCLRRRRRHAAAIGGRRRRLGTGPVCLDLHRIADVLHARVLAGRPLVPPTGLDGHRD